MNNQVRLGYWLFIGGSALFVGEAIADLTHHVSLTAIIHLAEGLFFLLGSLCFLPKADSKP